MRRRRVDEVGSPLLTAQTVKFFADGVVENETGRCWRRTARACTTTGMRQLGGRLRWPRRRAASTSSGLQIHIHAIGDAAVRQALDAIEYVVAAQRAT